MRQRKGGGGRAGKAVESEAYRVRERALANSGTAPLRVIPDQESPAELGDTFGWEKSGCGRRRRHHRHRHH